MARFPFDVVAFDLDGTLADTAPDLAAALNHTLGELGRPGVDPESVRHLVGHGARALLRRALESKELVERGLPIYLDYYAANICVGTRRYPSLEPAMDDLAARGAKLAICTNKPERLTHLLVDALGAARRSWPSVACGWISPRCARKWTGGTRSAGPGGSRP